MIARWTWKWLAVFVPLAWASPEDATAQVSGQVEDALRRVLMNRAEARLQLQGSRAALEPFLIRHPRLDSGLLVGEVETGAVGEIAVFESRAFPIDQIRELRVRESRFLRGTLLGAAFGVAVAGTLHAICAHDDDCVGPYRSPAVYALSGFTFAGVGGAVATFVMGWKVVYSRPQGLRIAQGGYRP
jgi:hypothetical protein